MNFRLTLIFSALVVLLGAMAWVVQDGRPAAVAPSTADSPTVAARVEPAFGHQIVPMSAIAAVDDAPAAAPAPQGKTSPMVHVDGSGGMRYIARDGDTVSQLAIALMGSDSKEHRDAVIAANPSLQSNPDHVLTGYPYSITLSSAKAAAAVNTDRTPDTASTVAAAPGNTKDDAPSVKPASDDETNGDSAVEAEGLKMTYTAQPGDTVSGLAAHLLGGDNKANRDGIIAENASLQVDADRVVAGQNYTITAPNGLSAGPDAQQPRTPANPPEADEAALLSVGRSLSYTAQPGDTVSKLAVVLLGSDTRANKDLIIKSNPSLIQDPDHLVAGQTYWIAAPTAAPVP